MISYNNIKGKVFAFINGRFVKIKKGYSYEDANFKKIYSAGNIVTYVVDTGVSYAVEVDSDESVLNPTTFTPSKPGWEFAGWREDETASGDVLTEKVMESEPIVLYAVFRQTVTVSYYQVANSTKQQKSEFKYYNNGNYVDPKFTISPSGYGTEWTFRGWGTGTTADASVVYSSINNTEFSSDVTLYVLLQRPVVVSYNGNSATSGSVASETKYVYLNSYGTNTQSNPSFTLKSNGFTRTNYTFSKWAQGSASGTQYAVGTSITLSQNTTFYAYWVETVKNFGYTGGVQTFTALADGTYKLEVWGAKGGNSSTTSGGNGGYSYGNIALTGGTTLYVVVGGAGTTSTYSSHGDSTTTSAIGGGYNGGNSGQNLTQKKWQSWTSYEYGGGGGATHISKNNGLITSASTIGLLISAGGGNGGITGHYWYPHDEDVDFDDTHGTTDSASGTPGNNSGTTTNLSTIASYSGGQKPSANSGGTGTYAYISGLSSSSYTKGAQSGNGSARITFVSAS